MVFLELFLGFLKVGCFAFGGAYAAIPLIRDVVRSYGFLTDELLERMIAVSESTPGPIMVNLATYVGADRAGLLGAALATFAVALPAFLIIILILTVFKNALKNRWIAAAMNALKACVIGVIFAVGAYMLLCNLLPALSGGSLLELRSAELFGSFDFRALVVTAVLAAVMIVYKKLKKKRFSPILLIVISAALGAAVYAV